MGRANMNDNEQVAVLALAVLFHAADIMGSEGIQNASPSEAFKQAREFLDEAERNGIEIAKVFRS